MTEDRQPLTRHFTPRDLTTNTLSPAEAEVRRLRAEIDHLRRLPQTAPYETAYELGQEIERLRQWIDTEGRNCPSNDAIDAVLRGPVDA